MIVFENAMEWCQYQKEGNMEIICMGLRTQKD